jgi:hypothetical protein
MVRVRAEYEHRIPQLVQEADVADAEAHLQARQPPPCGTAVLLVCVQSRHQLLCLPAVAGQRSAQPAQQAVGVALVKQVKT